MNPLTLKVQTRKVIISIVIYPTALILSWGVFTPAAAFVPQQNGNGVSWVSASAEAWSGGSQVSPSGLTVHLAGAFDSSVDTTSASGVVAYIGLLGPIGPVEEETPTPTEDGGEITPTPTECSVAEEGSDFDLNGDRVIQVRDLIMLIEAIKAGDENPYDFNCDGVTDDLDLYQFIRIWKVEIP